MRFYTFAVLVRCSQVQYKMHMVLIILNVNYSHFSWEAAIYFHPKMTIRKRIITSSGSVHLFALRCLMGPWKTNSLSPPCRKHLGVRCLMTQSSCCSHHCWPGPGTSRVMMIRKWGVQRSQWGFASLRVEKPHLGQGEDIVPISGCKQLDLLVRSSHLRNALYFYFKRNSSLPY